MKWVYYNKSKLSKKEVKMTNVQERQTNLKKIALLTSVELEAKSKYELVSYCRSIGLKTVYRTPDSKRKSSISGLRKAEIVHFLMLETEAHRKANLISDIDMTIVRGFTESNDDAYADLNQPVAEQLVLDYRDILNRSFDPVTETYKSTSAELGVLANRLYLNLVQRYPDNGVSGANNRLNNRSYIFRKFKAGLEATLGVTQHKNQVELDLNVFKAYLQLAFKQEAELKKKLGKETVNKRKKNCSAINISKVLDKARYVVAHYKTSHFYDLIISLVLLTGRRPYSEVCMAETDFEYVDANTVRFTGQAKSKGQSAEHYLEQPSYNIPVLGNALDVCKALHYLKSTGRLITRRDNEDDQNMRRRGNTRFSKEVSARVRSHWLNEIVWVQKSENPKKVTPHTFRELYALQACIDFAGVHNYDVAYAAKILGHDENDDTTAQRYQMDFKLVYNNR